MPTREEVASGSAPTQTAAFLIRGVPEADRFKIAQSISTNTPCTVRSSRGTVSCHFDPTTTNCRTFTTLDQLRTGNLSGADAYFCPNPLGQRATVSDGRMWQHGDFVLHWTPSGSRNEARVFRGVDVGVSLSSVQDPVGLKKRGSETATASWQPTHDIAVVQPCESFMMPMWKAATGQQETEEDDTGDRQ
jgi:hypothetical protein